MDQLEIIHSNDSVVISGNTKFYQKQFLKMNGKFNSASRQWVIPKSNWKMPRSIDNILLYTEFEIHSPFKLNHQYPNAPPNSRKCRYCHPEWAITLNDQVKSQLFPNKFKGINSDQTILELLTSEDRYRNKFFPEMLKWFSSNSRSIWSRLIRNHLNKHLKNKPVNDGNQTPYIKHAIYPAIHITACCCRGCIASWHGYSFSDTLSNAQIDYLVDTVMIFLDKYLMNPSNVQFQNWMTVSPRPNGYHDQFYTEGEYALRWNKTQLEVTKIGKGITDQSIVFRKHIKSQSKKNGMTPFEFLQSEARKLILVDDQVVDD